MHYPFIYNYNIKDYSSMIKRIAQYLVYNIEFIFNFYETNGMLKIFDNKKNDLNQYKSFVKKLYVVVNN